jgi:glycosyltransferase involved in cell wall biosynthesis
VEENPRTPRGVRLYHLGNNLLHRGIYERALREPGVVVLHDAVLHHFLLGWLSEAGYVDEFCFNYGEWHRGFARRLWKERARSAQDERYFRYPLLRRVVERARAVIVHNPGATAIVRTECENVPVVEIPHLWEAPAYPPEVWRVERLRHRLGVPSGGVVFGVFGHLRESKRLMTVWQAFERVQRTYPPARLMIAGRFVARDLARTLEAMFAHRAVIRVPYLKERDFWLYAAVVDVCVNLRYPAAGETSGIGIRFMGLGKATIVTSTAENGSYPTVGCLRVDPGLAEQEMLEAYLLRLSESPNLVVRIGLEASRHIQKEHNADLVAQRYREVLGAVAG